MEPEFARIAVAGADGQMGAMLAERFRRIGAEVLCYDAATPENQVAEIVANCKLLLLCIPVTAFPKALGLIAGKLKPGTVLADVCSVKEKPMKAMMEAYDGPVAGTHPLFGPVIPEGFKPRVAVAEGRDADAAAQVASLFESCGFSSFMTTAEEHDRAMAAIQGLNYITTAAYLGMASRLPQADKFVTPSFERRLDAARKMLTQDSALFADISEANPYLQETARNFMSYLSLAAGGDFDLLTSLAQWWWRDDDLREGCIRKTD